MDLFRNSISDINPLGKAKFKKLNTLSLYTNKISDISVLEKIKFEKLEELDLRNNKIDVEQNNLIISKMKSTLKI